MIDLSGMNIPVWGVANQRSICWAIAKQLRACGADVILLCQPRFRVSVMEMAIAEGIATVLPCDVDVHGDSDDDIANGSIDHCFCILKRYAPFHGLVHGLVHGIAFSDSKELQGRYSDTTLANFEKTMRISCYSFTEIARRMRPMMSYDGCMLTLTFDAATGSYPHYNVMGIAKAALNASVLYLAADLGEFNIRVNAISASPEDTLSARGIKNFRAIGKFANAQSPLGRRASLQAIANEAAYLLSDQACDITAQIRYVDCGSISVRMAPARNAALMAEAWTDIAKIAGKE